MLFFSMNLNEDIVDTEKTDVRLLMMSANFQD